MNWINAETSRMNWPLSVEIPVTHDLAPWYEKEHPNQGVGYRYLKRVLDLTLVVLSLPIVLPLLFICWLAVRLDSPGPAFFTQKRTGRGGRRFKIYKLRTMVVNAEELKKDLQELNELAYPDFKISHDPRVTRVGRILRRTSLDELPQIFNVILGEMSLVGPRPTSFKVETYSLWHTVRLEVRPGLTGLWQVSGRSALEFDDRLRLDIAYIRNRCLTLDFQILLRTLGAVVQGDGSDCGKSRRKRPEFKDGQSFGTESPATRRGTWKKSAAR